MEIGLVQRVDIDQEMRMAYLDYAMSVIVSRALPDARDGLKPVHRRILYAMHDMGLRADSGYKKSARIVGEVLGKYHPHGDLTVYEAMARMAQNFSMRYQLVDGQGNFGSVDGDPPAAMRYTEARLALPAIQMLSDIEKQTVRFSDNFDGTLQEPEVLPAAIPNLLVNGATGIAVGMATSIPPHNLGEVIDALQYMLENWTRLDDITVEDLMKYVKGPDFPTGGVILHEEGEESLLSAYSTGRGRITVRASTRLEEMERGRNRIIITELPYMTNKSSLIERIASLAREEKVEGIADLRDESDRQGMRIVIELLRSADPQEVLRILYKNTPMQNTFSIIMLALVDGEPRLLSLKQALRVYLEHRLEIIRKRSEYDLARAQHRAHVLEGLRIAIQNLDEVISLIRRSQNVDTARRNLRRRFSLSEIQAQAILDMPLRRLAALERKKIEEEYKEVKAQIRFLQGLLRSERKMRQLVGEELKAIRVNFGDRRKTHIVQIGQDQTPVSMLTMTDLTPEKTVWISVTPEGLISRSLEDNMPRISGRSAPEWLVQANTRDTLYLASTQGMAAAIPVHVIPEADDPANGAPYHNVCALRDSDEIGAIFSLPHIEENVVEKKKETYVMTMTRLGMLKKSPTSELPGPSAGLFTLVKVNPGDQLGWMGFTSGKDDILLVTSNGMGIRFSETEVRAMGLVAAGVMGIKLQAGDQLVGAEILPRSGEVFMLASDGSAKRVAINQFPRQGRYGQGVQTWKLPGKVTVVGIATGKANKRVIVHHSRLAPKAIRLDAAPTLGRTARGNAIFELSGRDLITRLIVPRQRIFK